MCKESGTLAIRYRKTLPKPRKYIVILRFCQDLPKSLQPTSTYAHFCISCCVSWMARAGDQGRKRCLGLRHGLEDGLGLRHGLEAWGKER